MKSRLKELLAKLEDANREVEKTRTWKLRKKAEIIALADQDVTSEAVQSAIDALQSAIAVADARLAKFSPEVGNLRRELDEALLAEVDAWNQAVKTAMELKIEAILAANAPFWPSQEHKFQHVLLNTGLIDRIPAVIELRKARFNLGDARRAEIRDALLCARNLLKKQEQFSKILGWT